MRAVTYLSLLALPAMAAALSTNEPVAVAARHGDDHDDDMNMDMMHGDSEHGHTDEGEDAASTIASSSAVPPPASTSASSAAKPAHAPHDPHSHHSHAPVKEYLDDQDIHYWHDFPPTYLDADFRLTNDSVIFGEELPADWPQGVPSHRGLMVLHVLCMVLAYFAILPIALALRAASHPSHYLANTAFLIVAILGWFWGVAYKAAMPDMYPGAKHGSIGSILLLVSIGLAVLDSFGLISRAVAFYRAGNRDWRSFFRDALQGTREDKFAEASRYEMVGLVHGDDDDDEHPPVFSIGDDEDDSRASSGRSSPRTARWAASRQSTGSDGTLHDSSPTSSRGSAHHFEMGADRHHKNKVLSRSRAGAFDAEHQPAWGEVATPDEPPVQVNKRLTAMRFAEIVLTWVRRTQVVLAYVCVCTGIPVYVGMCRAGFINTCAAHIIKGSIFFGYGVLTFARYLGAYADLGWAWNRKPKGSRAVSAEMVESAVIFTYGITNTWMERFGAKAGDPYTVKQVQHISIAVMFWFAGLSGMLLESRRIRRILGAVVSAASPNGRVREPASYAFSFNPFPALVIAITGLAMAAHHQDYKFQVEIHSLWGWLLAAGSVFRFSTYFFLWLRPPTESMLPSRPPTEVLTAFGWAAGGLVFMLSDEEVAFAAMRSGFDDMMAFLCFAVSLTCFVFTWITVVLAVKGYAVFRLSRGVQLAADEETSA